MAAVRWVVFRDEDSWSVARVTAKGPEIQRLEMPTAASAEDVADGVQQALHDQGYTGDAILLGLASETCQAAALRLNLQISARDHKALTYALEEKLPLSAEDFVADFLTTDPRSTTTLGVAVETVEVAPLLQALEDRGIVVDSLTPTALLALQGHLESQGSDQTCVVLWQNGQRIEWFLVEDGQPTDWRVLPADAISLRRELRVTTLNRVGPLPVVSYHLDVDLLASVSDVYELPSDQPQDTTLKNAAVTHAYRVLSGQSKSWIELRRGVLAPSDPYRAIRGVVRFTTVAVVILLIALTVSFLLRSYRYQQLAEQIQKQQGQLFAQLLPGQPVPVGIRSRLESEYVKLAGIAGQNVDLPATPSALDTLHALLSSVPDSPHLGVLELRLDPDGQLLLDARVPSHGDAARLATAMEAGGFQVEPPRSEQLADRTVLVTIIASLAGSP